MIDAAELKTIFEKDYNRAEWLHALREIFHIQNLHALPEPVDLPPNDFEAVAHELGFFESSEGLLIGLFEVSISPNKHLERIKSGLRNMMRNVYKRDMDAALIVFTQGSSWRFSYASELTVINKETGKREKRQTDPKRYTYLLGQGQHCRTAAERFASLKTSADLFDTKISIKEIEKAFSVDTLTKDFYRELSHWYFWALSHVKFPDDAEPNDEIRNSTNTIRLITRLIFVWFLKQKGLVPDTLFDKEQIWPHLKFGYEPQSTYYKAILQNLFFATLNQEMGKRNYRKDGQNYNITNLFRYKRLFRDPDESLELFKTIPFLNGGLFECLDKPHPTEKTAQGNEKIIRIDGFSDRDDNPLIVPDYLFFGGAEAVDLSMVYDDNRQKNVKVRGIIEILNSYSFTVEENTPLDIQVALDPELLGKVFENLLASFNPETKTTARKQTGSFYTPREIVNYMVDESLIAYLKQTLVPETKSEEDEVEEKLRDLVSYSGNGNPFDAQETQMLVKAIDLIKVLDPACGSGAFPMGVLQQLVHVLQKLDKDNHLWKQLQMQRAQAEIQDAISSGDTENFSAHIKEIAEAFDNNAEDYGRKLYLIENCIYGVDIQPIAVQIAKLRFFISLLVDQIINPESENLGIRALPNLETKFVAANTLIGLEAKMTLKPDKVYKLEKELEKVRHRHFSARTPETKRKYRQRDSELRKEIANELIDADFPETDANKISGWDPYDQNLSSPFFDKYWMFGLTDGFDVMIGNPPYVQIKQIPEEEKPYYFKNFQFATGRFNLFYFFIEITGKLTRVNGLTSYIVPDRLLLNTQCFDLRNWLLNYQTIREIDSFDESVFESAVVDSIIICYKNVKNKSKSVFARSNIAVNNIRLQNPISIPISYFNNSPNKQFDLNYSQVKSNLINKIRNNSISLGEISDTRDGIIQSKIPDVLFLTTKQNRFCQPLLFGKDINRYKINYDNNWVNYQPGEMMSIEISRSGGGLRLRTKEIFEREKILTRQTADKIIGALDKNNYYYSNTLHGTAIKDKTYDIKFILAVLNSSTMNYYYKSTTSEGGKVFAQIKIEILRQLPIKKANKLQQNPFVALVDKIISAKQSNPYADTTALENRIDELVFKLYDLTYEEVKVIAPDFWLGEEEYENLKVEG
jgi:adenine-specific DNA-methyltransferase